MWIRYKSFGTVYDVEIDEFDILTDKGLTAESIPGEEWTQGFRFKEGEKCAAMTATE